MIDFIDSAWGYITTMGEYHNVNPVLFAILYFGSIPPYMGSMVWAVHNHKKNKNISIPVITTLFFFILPALYVLLFGVNVAWWVYLVIAFITIYGGWSVIQKIKNQIKEAE